jgi:hypothetical protein
VSATTGIGTLNEGSLHAELKRLYLRPNDEAEVSLAGFVIDIVRNGGQDDEQLIEIQTGAFAAMSTKLDHLLEEHRILVVHPIAVDATLERPGRKPRRSPKKRDIYAVFDELVSLPTMLDHPHLELDVVLVSVVKVQGHDPRARRGRGGWRTLDRRLDRVHQIHRFSSVDDLVGLIPDGLPSPFTTADLAEAGGIRRDVAQRTAYCLRLAGRLENVGRTRAGLMYVRS